MVRMVTDCIHPWCPGLLYLCMKHLTDRYNMYYSYAPTKLSEQIHMAAVSQAIFAPLLGLFWMLFFSILRVGRCWVTPPYPLLLLCESLNTNTVSGERQGELGLALQTWPSPGTSQGTQVMDEHLSRALRPSGVQIALILVWARNFIFLHSKSRLTRKSIVMERWGGALVSRVFPLGSL